MKNQFEFRSQERINDVEMPPQEILRPGEQISELNDGELEANIEQVLGKKKSSKGIYSFLKRAATRGLAVLTLAYGLKIAEENAASKYDFSPDSSKSEQLNPADVPEIVIYGHKDKRTDQILNYLSGKEPMPIEFKNELKARLFFKNVLRHRDAIGGEENQNLPELEPYLVTIQERIEKTQSDEALFKKYCENKEYENDIINWHAFGIPKEFLEKHKLTVETEHDKLNALRVYSNESITDVVPSVAFNEMTDQEFKEYIVEDIICFRDFQKMFQKMVFDSKTYDAVWTMHQRHGNPEIDFSNDNSRRMNHGGRSYYNPLPNKMYLGTPDGSYDDDMSKWIAELSHAEQFDKKPVTTATRSIIDLFAILKDMLTQYSEKDKRESMYTIEGSLEYEAHSIIEPQLKEELKKRKHKDEQ